MKHLREYENKSNSRIMQYIDTLTGQLEGCNLAVENLSDVKNELDSLAEYLGVTDIQAILFASILSQNFKRRRVSVDHLSKFFKCSGIKVMKHIPDLKALQQKRWIRADSEANSKRSMLNDISFYVIREVFDRLMNGDGKLQPATPKDIYMILSELMDLAVEFDKERITHYEMMEEVNELVDSHRGLPYIDLLKQQGLNGEEELLFMLVCQRTLTGDAEVDLDQAVRLVTGSSYGGIRLKRNLVREKSKLITGRLLKLQDGLFRTDHEIVMTDEAIRRFFAEDADLLVKKSINSNNLVIADSIVPVKLFFNENEREHLDQIRKLMTQKGYRDVVRRLEKQHLRSGFTLLFHGAPGTGKTEAVYQIARRSGRDVMKVDLSQTKSMWFGESEKKIKEIFNQYRAFRGGSIRTPILLFNEADGVFSQRRELKDPSTSQTFNTMQNILLEEMENFKGILIATTNLTRNFDHAFERRFLYKIEFSSPDNETQVSIWRSKIKGLSNAVVLALTGSFHMSGGQIENVSRKVQINEILYGRDISFERLSIYCQEEKMEKQLHNAVGFKQTDNKRAS